MNTQTQDVVKNVVEKTYHLRRRIADGGNFPKLSNIGGATIVIQIDYDNKVCHAGLAITNKHGGQEPVTGRDFKVIMLPDNSGPKMRKVPPDSYCRRKGRQGALARITEPVKHSRMYFKITEQELQAGYALYLKNVLEHSVRDFSQLEGSLVAVTSKITFDNSLHGLFAIIALDNFKKQYPQIKDYE
jgi:hypothetical protein